MSGINLAGPPAALSAPIVIPGAKNPSDVLESLSTDASGNLLVNVAAGGGAGGTSSTFGDPFPGTGTAVGALDTGGDMAPLELDASGNLKVVVSGGGGSGFSAQDETTFTPATTNFVPAGGARLDAPVDVANGDQAAGRITPQRGLHSNLRKNDGTELGIVTAPLRTDPTGTTTQPVSAASLPLPSGAATSAKQDTEIASLASIDGKIPAQGQALMAASSPVVIASNQSAVPVSASALPLPSGAATEATLFSLNGKVTAVNTGAVVVSSSALPSGASTAAKQPALGTAGTASADVLTVQGIASMTALKTDGSAVTQPVSAASLPLPSGASTLAEQQSQTTSLQLLDDVVATTASAIPSKGFAISGTDGTNARVIKTDTSGELQVDVLTLPALPAGTNSIGAVTPAAATSGGGTPYKLISGASTNATSVKGSAGQVYAIAVFNLNASARYLKLYNKASAPTVGTDTPVQTYMIPGNAAGAGLTLSIPVGMAFGTGIAFALTTGIADADTGAVAASEICVNLVYL